MIELKPNLSQFRRSGRWIQGDSGSLIASWASASISFILTSSSLSIRLGPQTKRKFPFHNRDSTTLVCSLSDLTGSHHHHPSTSTSTQVLTFIDAKPGVLSLFDRLADGQQKLVKITMVEWSAVLELASIVVDNSDAVQLPPDPSLSPRILFIGDSVSCAYSPLQSSIPRGILDSFTSRAATYLGLPFDIIAYPGVTLVDPKADSGSFIRRKPGMTSRFFHAGPSPLDDTPAQLDERPTVIVIALGTNDRVIGVGSSIFVQTMRAFVTHLVGSYHETLAHICILHPFRFFGAQPQPDFAHAFPQIADQVAADHPNLGVHVWDLGNALDRSLTTDWLHPSVQGHDELGETLAGHLRPLVAGT